MPGLRLRRRREDRLGKLVALAQPGGQLNAADAPVAPVILPARSGNIPPRHALHFHHLGAVNQHRPAFQLIAIGVELGRIIADVRRDEVIRNDVPQLFQPEQRQRGQHAALVAESASGARSRMPRAGRWRRSPGIRRPHKRRALCRGRSAQCRADWFQKLEPSLSNSTGITTPGNFSMRGPNSDRSSS